MKLFPDQQQLQDAVFSSWERGNNVVCAVSPTGGGKTVLTSSIIDKMNVPTVAIAHRKELLGQLATTLAQWGVRHNIIAPRSTVKKIVNRQLQKLGRHAYDPSAPVNIASIDTLARRDPEPWMTQIKLWFIDEGHHILRGNKWGRGLDLFPNAKGLTVTATPCRADGKGLGSHADGVIDDLVVGLNMRQLIDIGRLSDYIIYAPLTKDLHLEDVGVGADGDYKRAKLASAVKKSSIVGDVVDNYLKFAAGKRGITFAVSVEQASDIARRYSERGVPAAVVHAKTNEDVREQAIKDLENGDLLQLVNVDLFDEGVDVPAVEVLSMARPTKSYPKFSQQFGRVLRVIDGKECAIIIDHVGNVQEHGLPDCARLWSLDAKQTRPRKARGDEIPLSTCGHCARAYRVVLTACPYCGEEPVKQPREDPREVDGDLHLLTSETLEQMRREAQRLVDEARVPQHLPSHVQAKIRRDHQERRNLQYALRKMIAMWSAYQREQGLSQRECAKMFYYRFGVDVLAAQSIKSYSDTFALCDIVARDLGVCHKEFIEGGTNDKPCHV